MTNRFIGFYRPEEHQFASLWQTATIVIDANLLLNLYCYPKAAREEMLGVLEKVADRLWVPFHAVLEYQRNRAAILKEQKGRFRDVRDIVASARGDLRNKLEQLNLPERHSLIDPASLLDSVEEAVQDFLSKLDKLEEEQVDVHQHDSLRDRIDKILVGCVGEEPSQAELDAVKADALKRFEFNIPPGNADAGKDQGKNPRYSYGGLKYDSALGDLYIWKQLLSYSAKANPSGVILVTDDRKPDWWNIIDSGGRKTLGPRPELIDEIRRESGVQSFWMYKADQFVKHARERISAEVSDQSIAQIQATAPTFRILSDATFDYAERAEQAVFEWVDQFTFGDVTSTPFDSCDFVTKDFQGNEHGYEVIVASQSISETIDRLRGQVARAFSIRNQGVYEQYTIVLVTRGPKSSQRILEKMREMRLQYPEDVEVIIGHVGPGVGEGYHFVEDTRIEDLRT